MTELQNLDRTSSSSVAILWRAFNPELVQQLAHATWDEAVLILRALAKTGAKVERGDLEQGNRRAVWADYAQNLKALSSVEPPLSPREQLRTEMAAAKLADDAEDASEGPHRPGVRGPRAPTHDI